MLTENYKIRLQELAGIEKKIIAYHGTPHEFDKFKLQKSGSQNNAGDFGRGIYFSTDKKVAETYANDSNGFILTVELSVKNPYAIDYEKYSSYKTKQEKGEIDRNLINPEVQKYIDVLKSGGADFGLSDVKNQETRAIDFLSISDNFGAKEISKCLEKEGYDAIIIKYGSGDEIVVFDDNQTKITKREKLNE
jgi:hypothetical protein